MDMIPNDASPRRLLSDRESTVLWLASRGLTPEEIGVQLGMSPIAVRALAHALRRVLQDPQPSHQQTPSD